MLSSGLTEIKNQLHLCVHTLGLFYILTYNHFSNDRPYHWHQLTVVLNARTSNELPDFYGHMREHNRNNYGYCPIRGIHTS